MKHIYKVDIASNTIYSTVFVEARNKIMAERLVQEKLDRGNNGSSNAAFVFSINLFLDNGEIIRSL